MNISGILEYVPVLNVDVLLKGIKIPFQDLWGMVLVSIIVTVALGILLCFFGLKLVRVWSAVLGFLGGFVIGSIIARQFTISPTGLLITGIVSGIVLACLVTIWYRVSIFFVVFCGGAAIASYFVVPIDLLGTGICFGIGLLLALLTIIHAESVAMILTGFLGAMNLGTLAFMLLPIQGIWLPIVVSFICAVLGIWVQFVMESGKRKKLNLKKAKEIKEQTSRETEVEKARAFMDELEHSEKETEE